MGEERMKIIWICIYMSLTDNCLSPDALPPFIYNAILRLKNKNVQS